MHSRKLIDYKNIKLLYRFIGCQGKIIPRRVSRVAFAVQRLLSAAIQKVRILALLPFVENKKRSQKVRMLKQRIKEKKKEKRYKGR
uniref:ribosomal protein S18 n=1 Tax=Juncus compressus TaxID=223661 RepID=UPI001F133AA2|nr:ribosomal protein S18 [Juncus compressus]ULQ66727.1 ribosomal protein S18 [Juncus compressus]